MGQQLLHEIKKFYMKFGHLILGKSLNLFLADFRLKCTKFNFVCGSAIDPLASLHRSPEHLVEVKGAYFD